MVLRMELPHAERAFADLAKLRDCSPDPAHPEGKHKARVFASALGLSRNDAGWLREELQNSQYRSKFGRLNALERELHRLDETLVVKLHAVNARHAMVAIGFTRLSTQSLEFDLKKQ